MAKPPKVKLKVSPLSAISEPVKMNHGGSVINALKATLANREGFYAARRLERAADEIPNLEKLYQDQAILRAFNGDNDQAVMTMKPSDFERYAAPLGSGLSDRSLQNIANLQNIQNNGGFSDVPYLNINKKEQGTMGLPYISGHEGRHRNRAMDAAGEQAGLVQLVPRSELREPFPRRSREDYLEALYKEMQLTGNRVKPEAYYLDPKDDKTYQRRAIELPEFYADGGMVDSVPEEAIKNTVRDSQAARLLDLDLAKYALMNQPQRMAQGGQAMSEAIGGQVQTPVQGDMGKMSFDQYRTSIGMHEGGRHMAQGGQVQRFDEGGQASLDQMRYEFSNSPVMQATPRSPMQDFIGTVGGYMDRAGKFVSEAIEPTAEKHPVKHFLSNMLLADPLKGAGTALQDYTSTVRETDEDNPVRGVVSKDWKNLTTSREPMIDPRVLDVAQYAAPNVKGITKLGEAGAKAITPFAKSADEMRKELLRNKHG